jgi:hypothetical protein
MTTIECPNCHTSFEVNANSYNSVVHQIKNVEFQKEIQARLEEEQRLYEEKVKSLEKEHKFEQSKAIDRVIADKDEEIQRLESNLKIAKSEAQHQLQLLKTQADADQKEAVHQAEDRLKDEHSKELQTLTAKYDDQLKTKNDELERIQNYKNRLSTKMIGESLEQFCETEFNKLRATAFPKVFFEKDNDAKSGSKCDFIFGNKRKTELSSFQSHSR